MGASLVQRHFVCPVCNNGFHLSKPGAYQDGKGRIFCSKGCYDKCPRAGVMLAEIQKVEVTGVVTVDSPVSWGPLGAQQELERLNDGSHLAAKTIEPEHTLMVRDGVAFGGAETEVIGGFRRPEAPQVSVPCSRPGCNTTTIFHLGTLDPKQGSCAHVLVPRHLGMSGLECRGCGLKIGAHALRAAGFLPENSPYDRRVQTMADECQRLKDENRGLLVENATLRRKLERRR